MRHQCISCLVFVNKDLGRRGPRTLGREAAPRDAGSGGRLALGALLSLLCRPWLLEVWDTSRQLRGIMA